MKNLTKGAAAKMDPLTRRKLLFSLSQPTNPVPGALLSHLANNATDRAMQSWERSGWIVREGPNYYLTKLGSEVISAPQVVPPPDSFYPHSFTYK